MDKASDAPATLTPAGERGLSVDGTNSKLTDPAGIIYLQDHQRGHSRCVCNLYGNGPRDSPVRNRSLQNGQAILTTNLYGSGAEIAAEPYLRPRRDPACHHCCAPFFWGHKLWFLYKHAMCFSD